MGAAAIAIFKSKDIAVTKVDAAKIGFMKLGKDGTIVQQNSMYVSSLLCSYICLLLVFTYLNV